MSLSIIFPRSIFFPPSFFLSVSYKFSSIFVFSLSFFMSPSFPFPCNFSILITCLFYYFFHICLFLCLAFSFSFLSYFCLFAFVFLFFFCFHISVFTFMCVPSSLSSFKPFHVPLNFLMRLSSIFAFVSVHFFSIPAPASFFHQNSFWLMILTSWWYEGGNDYLPPKINPQNLSPSIRYHQISDCSLNENNCFVPWTWINRPTTVDFPSAIDCCANHW